MDEKSLQLLDFPIIREYIARETSFLPSRELALTLEPLNDFEQIKRLLRQSAEARLLLKTEPLFTIGNIFDIRESVKLAILGKILEPQRYLEIRDTLASCYFIHTRLSTLKTEFPLLWDIVKGMIIHREIEYAVSNCFSPDGEIKDNASQNLTRIRQQLKSVRIKLLAHLNEMLNSPRWQAAIQEPIITEREGRYVIPIKVDSRKNVKGIVHDLSNTGATVFVEPWVTVDAGNQLRELLIEETHEIENILRNLSDQIGNHATEILHCINNIAELDLVIAKAKYANNINATEPEMIIPEQPENKQSVLRLFQARHPLLHRDSVPLSVELGQEYSILIITGPNTGGKTVTLKTIGLLSLMAQSGIPIPASPNSTLPVFDNIFADIGDEQSIEQTLSTFSWHITNMIRIVNQVTNRSIVLMDELGTSTDPAEGAALAKALLNYFLKRGTLVLTTTHFSELKAYAHTTPGMQNASLDFDPVTFAPKYHLTIGIPSGSNALATAARFGLSHEIVTDAKNMLTHGNLEIETLLGDLVSEKQNFVMQRKLIEKEEYDLAQRHAVLEDKIKKIQSDERRIISEARDKTVREFAEISKEIRQISIELRKEKSKAKIDEARRIMTNIQNKINGLTFTPTAEEATANIGIIPGDTVWLIDGNVVATVISISEDKRLLELQIGAAKVKASLESVRQIAKSLQIAPHERILITTAEKRNVPKELDLRGKRAESIEQTVDSYLDNAAIAGMGRVRIIHGYGTGVVRQIVRDVLSSHPLVKNWRAGERGEGGDGVAIVNLQ